ncbi:MAG: NAD(P)-dependent oxidoreductase [Chloroflexaceae bacterium]|jgi:3-hydroxyisobutyrate dehydrogenase-like beta-hydroxyacid dehydrogenase|nr:NAD(P)-dependent oxidoreductase [Chloroflexaceae bacterium]
MQIGFVGLGRMGQAMVPRLLECGFAVQVWNRTPGRATPLLALGATQADSLPALASHCDLTFTMLTDDGAVEAVFSPTSGLLAGEVAGKLFIEMSTIRPSTIHTVAALARERGASLLDAPMSGTVGPARSGQLLALVGGAAADVERARPVLEALCRRVAHVGPSGSGTTMKLVLNMPMAIYWQALAESLALGSQAGLDLAQMLDLIADSPAGIGALRIKIPVILGEQQPVAFDVTGVRKDLLAMTATAQLHGVPTPTGSAALASFAAATAAGHGTEDLAALIPYYIELVRKTAGQ